MPRPMKLLLCSYRLGAHGPALRGLAGAGARVGLIFNACDAYDDRLRNLDRETADLVACGFQCEELDLRGYFEQSERLRERLDRYDGLWVVGGNTFVLARAMASSGLQEAAEPRLADGGLVYAGYSAGVCVAAPDLVGIHLMDDPAARPNGYPTETVATTLAWLPWRVVPHWHSDHPETALADQAVEYLLAEGLPFRTLRDGQAIVFDGPTPSDGLVVDG